MPTEQRLRNCDRHDQETHIHAMARSKGYLVYLTATILLLTFFNGTCAQGPFFILGSLVEFNPQTGQTQPLVSNPSDWNVAALAVDDSTGFCYLAEYNKQGIFKLDLYSGNVTIVTDIQVQYNGGLAVDSSRQTLFYAQYWNGQIFEMNTDGTGIRTVLSLPTARPVAMALDTANSWIYWTELVLAPSDVNISSPGVYKTPYSGGSRTKLISSDSISGPLALAIDVAAGVMYWGDATSFTHGVDLGILYTANLDGSMPATLATVRVATNCLVMTSTDLYFINDPYYQIEMISRTSHVMSDVYTGNLGYISEMKLTSIWAFSARPSTSTSASPITSSSTSTPSQGCDPNCAGLCTNSQAGGCDGPCKTGYRLVSGHCVAAIGVTQSVSAAAVSMTPAAGLCPIRRSEQNYWRGLYRNSCLLSCSAKTRLHSSSSESSSYSVVPFGTALKYQNRRARSAAGTIWLKVAVATYPSQNGWVRSVDIRRKYPRGQKPHGKQKYRPCY